MVPTSAFELFAHLPWHNRQRDELGMRVLQRGASRCPMVLENDDVAEADVALEIVHAVSPGKEHLFDGRFGHRRERVAVPRCFDDDLVSTNAVHPVE